jgi:hypothetical protein
MRSGCICAAMAAAVVRRIVAELDMTSSICWIEACRAWSPPPKPPMSTGLIFVHEKLPTLSDPAYARSTSANCEMNQRAIQ